ncbi:hypothetical protein Glove_360g23 [Diversispora epigaea]|uniref:Uncharacterized protein n=1 Tax=Diversispora epigaea TaxID=1348612 RepID=A0A397H9X7_9GLOM|nr:hypothetical protein Glove_360g23 [Diversispora epigaea]
MRHHKIGPEQLDQSLETNKAEYNALSSAKNLKIFVNSSGNASAMMAPKKSNKNPDSQQSEKPTKLRPPLCNKINKIWKSEDPYSYANSIGKPNLPDWYPNNTKIEKAEISPEPTPQEIITPEEPKPDSIEVKRKRKTTEIENIACRVMRSELIAPHIHTLWRLVAYETHSNEVELQQALRRLCFSPSQEFFKEVEMGGFDSEFQFRINNDPHNQIFLIDLPFETPVKEAIPIIKDEMEAQDNPVSKFDLYADTPFLPPMKLGPNDKISEYFNVNHPDENYIIIKPSPNPTKEQAKTKLKKVIRVQSSLISISAVIRNCKLWEDEISSLCALTLEERSSSLNEFHFP